MGCGWSRQWQTHTHSRTHTHRLSRDTQDGWSPGQGLDGILTHGGVALPLIKLMCYEHREDAVGVRGAGNDKHTHTPTHTHCVPRDTQGECSLVQGWDTILTHVGVAQPLIKLLGYEHSEDALGGEGRRPWQTHTHTVYLVIHSMDGASCKDRTRS